MSADREEAHAADPSARRLLLILLFAVAIAGALLVVGASTMWPAIETWIKEDVQSRITIVIVVVTLIASGPPLALALYLWQFGGRVIRAARFPPPEARLIQAMPIIVGDAARRRGMALRVFAGGVGVTALLIAATLLRFIFLI